VLRTLEAAGVLGQQALRSQRTALRDLLKVTVSMK
jgi:hypothetical protein